MDPAPAMPLTAHPLRDRILAALRDFADLKAGRPGRIVGEPIRPGRSPAEVLEATRHEALVTRP
ncbi:hypothetical protein OG730_37890 [Streptomyces sp. NBC_01298]|uniref:hypothetical protein n=1 Tax=Streptomyces sp. NBC_01298 TaxID=2903817 RepID=UPI002E0E5AAC|nr:hypothetical protein OG730_37890 [Streptomyces sp. NBC_01298]